MTLWYHLSSRNGWRRQVSGVGELPLRLKDSAERQAPYSGHTLTVTGQVLGPHCPCCPQTLRETVNSPLHDIKWAL